MFNWLAALAVKLEPDSLLPLLPVVLLPVMRELSTTDEQGVTIRRMAKEVLKYYRQKTDACKYDKTVIRVQKFLDIKRAKRKMQVAQMVSLRNSSSYIIPRDWSLSLSFIVVDV